MIDSITIPQFFRRAAVDKGRWPLYLGLALIANMGIWGVALLYLKVTPLTYSSQWAITLPGSGSTTKVDLPKIGGASYENLSPYASDQDPREDYKIIAQSEPVLKVAARDLNMPLKKFGSPRIKIIDSTTIMNFELKGASPQEAQNKSLALYKSIEARLKELRNEEGVQRNANLQAALNSSQKKLESAQKRLSEYKARSGLSSSDQITNLSVNIEQLRKQQAETLAQQKQASTRLAQLSSNLNLSAQQATDAFVLQMDQLFQQYLKDYNDASATLVALNSKFLPNYAGVVSQKANRDAAQVALLERSQFLLGRPVSQAALVQLNLNNTNSGSSQEALLRELVTLQADKQGLQGEAQEINRQITKLENRLKVLAQHESTLAALQRQMEIAEAVFSSTLAKLDIGKSNTFASYPPIQILTKPSLPDTPSSPKKKLVFLGAALASLFLTSGLLLLFLHEHKAWRRNKTMDQKTLRL
jgi:uncharacterized protein involved in exopolysaccharide biosynthesis